jgi:uncharacterized membrane protein YphA (DoxX/SURF4 family)
MFNSNRPVRPSAILLRLGLGAYLLFVGYSAMMAGTTSQGTDAAAADAEGVQLALSWEGLSGVGFMAAGGFLVIGLMTRLLAMPMAAASALTAIDQAACFAGTCCGSDAPMQACKVTQAAAQIVPDVPTAILMGGVALSLLASGCGGFGLDRLLFRKRRDAAEDLDTDDPRNNRKRM